MEQDFTEAMSRRTNEELIEIVTVKRDDYLSDAIETAEKVLKSRQVDYDLFEQVKDNLIEQEIKHKKVESTKANLWLRLIHCVIDSIVFFLLAVISSIIVDFFMPTSISQMAIGLIMYIVFFLIFLLYYMFMEYKYQKTLGKFLTKTKVVMNSGKKPTLNEIFIRTVCRLIPFDNISFLFMKNGFHDSLSDTTVIKEKKTLMG